MERQYVWLDEFSCTFGEIVHQLVQQHGQQPKVKEKNYVEEEKQDERKEQYGLVESGVGFYQQLQSQIHKEVETHLQQTVCIQQLECKQKNKMQQSFIHQKTKSLLKSRQLEQDPSSIRIAVFNALADGLAQFGSFFRCNPENLVWDVRCPLFEKEVKALSSDIFGVVECNHYIDFWEPMLAKEGFHSMFIPKERSPAELLGFEADGCCLGYQASKFECLSSNKAAIPLVHVIAQLKNLSTNQIFTVCVVHQKAGVEFSHIRSKQMSYILKQLDSFQKLCHHLSSTTILMGDFNAPYHEPCFVSAIENGFANILEKDGRILMPWTTWKFRRKDISESVSASIGRREYEKKDCIDHILVKPAAYLQGFLACPEDSSLEDTALPTVTWPSDHISVLACVRFIDTQL
eukprot:gene6610-9420_t